jgi:hypothetical protein
MLLTDNVKIVFKHDTDDTTAEITITAKQLLENTTDDFYEMLDDTQPCMSATCNSESQNFCDCDSGYEDYTIVEIIPC